MADYYTMPEGRTYCRHFRCCREQGHQGGCEIDITYLTEEQLQSIRNSAKEAPVAERVEITGNIRVHHPVREVAQACQHPRGCCAHVTGDPRDCCQP